MIHQNGSIFPWNYHCIHVNDLWFVQFAIWTICLKNPAKNISKFTEKNASIHCLRYLNHSYISSWSYRVCLHKKLFVRESSPMLIFGLDFFLLSSFFFLLLLRFSFRLNMLIPPPTRNNWLNVFTDDSS